LSTNNNKFRLDINALRTVAILGVLIFHFNSGYIPGGFVGVDVFFVISGYLMTKIIITGIDNGTFNFKSFVIARIKRIVPALLFLCICLTIYLWFYLYNIPARELSKHIASSLLFFSNILYWTESGYFDSASSTKWLLHTWSLSVEWQFYILLPVFALILKKLGILKYTSSFLLIFMGASFLLGAVSSAYWPSPSYYFLPTRAWEMLMGSIAFYILSSRDIVNNKILHCLGLALILVSMFIIDETFNWPGWAALIPTVGTFLVLISNYQKNIVFNSGLVQFFGKISYSLYLWHWPLLVLFKYYISMNMMIYFVASILLSSVSYFFVEKIRNVTFIVVTTLLMVLFSWYNYVYISEYNVRLMSQDKKNYYLSKYSEYRMDPSGYFDKCNPALRMTINGKPEIDKACLAKNKNGVLIWGDSHIASVATGLRKFLKQEYISQLTSSGCEPSFTMRRKGLSRADVGCDYANEQVVDLIEKVKPSTVLLGARQNHTNVDWNASITKLRELGVTKVIIVGPLLQWKSSFPLIYTNTAWDNKYYSGVDFDKTIFDNNDFMKKTIYKDPNVIYVNIIDQLCLLDSTRQYRCLVKFDNDLITFDYGHLTVNASIEIFKEQILPLIDNGMYQ
jgi:peptidoglycan/LPS O-acetylase OafA/YrhL